MHVELLATLPVADHHPTFSSLDRAIAQAARTSYRKEAGDDERDKKLIRYLIKQHHTSPLEQVEFQFRIEAPLVIWWHLLRHRVGEYNLSSGRYTAYEADRFYLPETWRTQSTKNKQGSEAVHPQSSVFTALLDVHIYQSRLLYEQALKAGVAREMARFFLPGFLVYHTGVCKWNLHSVINLIHRRNHPDAQEETRQIARLIQEEVEQVLPFTSGVVFP